MTSDIRYCNIKNGLNHIMHYNFHVIQLILHLFYVYDQIKALDTNIIVKLSIVIHVRDSTSKTKQVTMRAWPVVRSIFNIAMS